MATLLRAIVFSFFVSTLPAQVTVANLGYRIPSNVISAAPGQMVVISFANVTGKPRGSFNNLPGPSGYPLQINGLSIKVTDGGAAPLDAGLIAYRRTDGPKPVTSLTVVIPTQLAVHSSGWFAFTGSLTLSDNGVVIAEFPFRPVPDNVHFLNSCDETGIFVSILVDVPTVSDCIPVVINKSALVTTSANPIRPGDGVAAYLYGLGAVELRDDPFRRPEPVQSFDLHFDYRPNAPASRAVPGYGLTSKPFFAVGFPGGLYQVNFFVPPPPPGIDLPECDGTTIRSNLTVTLSGLNSFDSASFCVRR